MFEIDNPFTMVVLIVMIVFGSKMYMETVRLKRQQNTFVDDEEAASLKREVNDLRERVRTLERIVTDKESQLARDIERL